MPPICHLARISTLLYRFARQKSADIILITRETHWGWRRCRHQQAPAVLKLGPQACSLEYQLVARK